MIAKHIRDAEKAYAQMNATAEGRRFRRSMAPASSSAFVTTTEVHKFKKGQKMGLDEIYEIQGLAGGRWWTADDPYDDEGTGGEEVTITEDITITIKVKRRNTEGQLTGAARPQP